MRRLVVRKYDATVISWLEIACLCSKVTHPPTSTSKVIKAKYDWIVLKLSLTMLSYLVGEAGANRGLDALIQVCISKNNGRVFTSQLQRELLTVGGTPLCDVLGSCRGASEGNQWDVRMANECVACSRASAKYNVEYSWRNTCRDRTVLYLCVCVCKWIAIALWVL